MRAVEGSLGHSPQERYREVGRPSPWLMARPGKSIAKQSEGRAGEKYLPVGGRVRKLRAVEDQSAPILREKRASLEGACMSFDARSKGQPRPLPP